MVALTMMLAACGGDTGQTDSDAAGSRAAHSTSVTADHRVSESVRDTPCEAVPAAALAAAFGIPEAQIEVRSFVKGRCTCSWEGDGRRLNVSLNLSDVAQDARVASGRFARATRSMSAEEVGDAMKKVSEAASGTSGSQASNATGQPLQKVLAGKGIAFADVPGVGDEARVNKYGELHVRSGNLLFTVQGDFGPPQAQDYAGNTDTAIRVAHIVLKTLSAPGAP